MDMKKEIEDMIDFLESRKFVAYNLGKKLDKADWKTKWGWDIIWRKN